MLPVPQTTVVEMLNVAVNEETARATAVLTVLSDRVKAS